MTSSVDSSFHANNVAANEAGAFNAEIAPIKLKTRKGEVSFAATWPPGVPAGFSIYTQWWIEDPTGPVGFAASNGLQGTTP